MSFNLPQRAGSLIFGVIAKTVTELFECLRPIPSKLVSFFRKKCLTEHAGAIEVAKSGAMWSDMQVEAQPVFARQIAGYSPTLIVDYSGRTTWALSIYAFLIGVLPALSLVGSALALPRQVRAQWTWAALWFAGIAMITFGFEP